MYTPHFFSKIQMLLGPNLAHLLSAQDQGDTYGYGDRVETPHGTTIGCEKSSNGL